MRDGWLHKYCNRKKIAQISDCEQSVFLNLGNLLFRVIIALLTPHCVYEMKFNLIISNNGKWQNYAGDDKAICAAATPEVREIGQPVTDFQAVILPGLSILFWFLK